MTSGNIDNQFGDNLKKKKIVEARKGVLRGDGVALPGCFSKRRGEAGREFKGNCLGGGRVNSRFIFWGVLGRMGGP